MADFLKVVTYIPSGMADTSQWMAAMLAFLVSLLTMYNAAKLRRGVLAVSTYAFGTGMLSLALGFLVIAAPAWSDHETINLVYHLLFIVGFALLGFGSFKIYRMSQIK